MEYIDVSAKADRSVVTIGLFPTMAWRSVRKIGNKRSKENTVYLNLGKITFSLKSDKSRILCSLHEYLLVSMFYDIYGLIILWYL